MFYFEMVEARSLLVNYFLVLCFCKVPNVCTSWYGLESNYLFFYFYRLKL